MNRVQRLRRFCPTLLLAVSERQCRSCPSVVRHEVTRPWGAVRFPS